MRVTNFEISLYLYCNKDSKNL